MVQGAAIFIYSCTLHHKIQSENQHLTTKRKAQVQTLFCSSYFFHTLLIFPSYRKTKNLLFFSFFSQNYYICTSSKSRAKQCSETRTATKSLPVTELPTLYVLSIKLLKEIYRFSYKNIDEILSYSFFFHNSNVDRFGFRLSYTCGIWITYTIALIFLPFHLLIWLSILIF